jgi:two-component system, OmpR family, sensor histidine kinase KdpD
VSRKSGRDHGLALIRLPAPFRPRTRPQRATAEAAALARLAASVLSGHGDPPALVEEIREMFGLDAVSLLERGRNGTGPCWFVMASAGDRPPDGPCAAVSLPVTDTFTLAGRGRALSAEDMRLLSCCVVPVLAGLVRRRQDDRDAHVARQAADSHSRSALLATTGRQAREQLQLAETALAVLADPAVTVTPAERTALASDARRALAHVTRLLTDLRDLRRVQSGALETYQRSVSLDEVLGETLADLGPGGPEITLSIPEDLPDVIADVDLLSRILTSLIADALHRSQADCPPALAAACRAGRIEIQITDHGSPQAEADSLGFRLARDFTETMGDALQCTQNEDGGRTVIITLPAAATR